MASPPPVVQLDIDLDSRTGNRSMFIDVALPPNTSIQDVQRFLKKNLRHFITELKKLHAQGEELTTSHIVALTPPPPTLKPAFSSDMVDALIDRVQFHAQIHACYKWTEIRKEAFFVDLPFTPKNLMEKWKQMIRQKFPSESFSGLQLARAKDIDEDIRAHVFYITARSECGAAEAVLRNANRVGFGITAADAALATSRVKLHAAEAFYNVTHDAVLAGNRVQEAEVANRAAKAVREGTNVGDPDFAAATQAVIEANNRLVHARGEHTNAMIMVAEIKDARASTRAADIASATVAQANAARANQ